MKENLAGSTVFMEVGETNIPMSNLLKKAQTNINGVHAMTNIAIQNTHRSTETGQDGLRLIGMSRVSKTWFSFQL